MSSGEVVMLILEQSVHKVHWEAIRDYIVRRLNTNRFERIPGTRVLHVFGGENTRSYAIVRDGLPIAWLYLGKRPLWKAWEVKQVWVFKDVRDEGLASEIYKVAVNRDGILLASGKTQSKSSRALWRKLVRQRAFNVWAQDFNNLDLRSQVWFEDDELHSELELYSRVPNKHDVRFIAFKKVTHELPRHPNRKHAELNRNRQRPVRRRS